MSRLYQEYLKETLALVRLVVENMPILSMFWGGSMRHLLSRNMVENY